MKIVITGSLGNISKPLAQELIQNGHSVTIISSKADKQTDIEALGATAAIGSLEDVDFLIKTFTGADAVYSMVPPNYAEIDQIAYYTKIGNNYVEAIRQSGVSRIVNLSSYGAHLPKDTGFIAGSYHAEQLLNQLSDVGITHVRPAYFYYNLYSFIPMIKAAGFIGANYGGEDRLTIVSPNDIAAAVADEIVKTAEGIKIKYISSDDRTCNEIAGVLGQAIGIPHLKWITLTSKQMHEGLIGNGVPLHIADNLVEMGSATHSGILREDYDQHTPVIGKIKLEDFATDFAIAYNSKLKQHS